MTNEIRRDLTNDRRRRETGNQKEILATHASQLKYLDTCSRSESDRQNNYSDIATLPGVKVPFVVRPEPLPRKTMRNSIRKLPRKYSSAKEKKKEAEKDKRKVSESEKPKQNGKEVNASSPAKKETMYDIATAAANIQQTDTDCHEGATVTCDKVVVTQMERPVLGSLDASELMLVSSDKGDLGTMVLVNKNSEDSTALCTTKDNNGETPLHKAAKGGYLKCLKFLASQVPDQVSSLDNSGMTPAAHAAKNGHVNCLKWLVEESSAYVELAVRDGQTHLLHHAASEGMEQCLIYLLAFMEKRKITTDIIDATGQSPLHASAKMGHPACIQTLVEHGADVLAKDHEGLTASSVAYIQKQSICSRYLLMAESCWILASRVATLFREVNGYKKENKELKKSVENLKARKKSFPKDLPHRPETVGALVDECGNQIEDISQSDKKVSIGIRERNFPDGESPKSTFTEADKRRPQNISPRSRMINSDPEVQDVQHLKLVRQGSNTSDSIPVVSTTGIAEIPPAEKVKAKEIAMVTHQLMSTRRLQLVKNKKTKDTSPPEIGKFKPDSKSQTSVDDSAVVMRRSNTRNKNNRPKSLCDKDLRFMRSASDVAFNRSKPNQGILERRASCTEINKQSKLEENETTSQKTSKESSDSDLSPTDQNPEKETFWDNVGARKLLSRKKNTKPRSLSGGLSDLQTVSTDKILELYARESRGSSSRINSLIEEEDKNSLGIGRRTMSSLELKSHACVRDGSIHASFREPRLKLQALSDLRMSERYTESTSKSCDQKPKVEKRIRPVAKPRLKIRSSSETNVLKQTVECFTTSEVHRTVRADNLDHLKEDVHCFKNTLDNYGYALDRDRETQDSQENLECTDV
ncbi:protein phosphatase 1 regulatory subunit 12C-like isoform X2 [Dendronephthya gigantea]|uniref:protein phosphatase 1 regulatory subunit 12C-like isoform X2 n=1 Tax=Dendronephthya gigantea TaxID=151771 RepID=UPI00106A30D6|nr:protein phosphatase 1 regulatory subunit 12C-like isoform X2 [Dendronephthya gigantea]